MLGKLLAEETSQVARLFFSQAPARQMAFMAALCTVHPDGKVTATDLKNLSTKAPLHLSDQAPAGFMLCRHFEEKTIISTPKVVTKCEARDSHNESTGSPEVVGAPTPGEATDYLLLIAAMSARKLKVPVTVVTTANGANEANVAHTVYKPSI